MNFSHQLVIPALLIASMTLSSSTLAAEEGAISADRPGLSTGTHTVAPGVYYVELGYQYEFNNTGVDTATHTLPQLVLRTGLSDKIELDFIFDGWNQDKVEGFD